MTCKDCINFDDCIERGDVAAKNLTEGAEKECDLFKNKADFVKVVRCKDCRHGEKTTKFRTDCTTKCGLFDKTFVDNDFCSYGERKE